jgi:hypothetical protein
MQDFYTLWNFPNCCGAIDGKHIVIRCPSKSGSEFYNYKKVYSVILLAIVDANYKFIYIDVGTNGRVNDALVFSKSTFNEVLQTNTLNLPTEGVFVGDDAFPLRKNIMKPYSMKRPLTVKERIFNYRLSRARRVSENAFGIMVSRFRVYEKPIPLQLHKVDQLIKATCVLHNWLRQSTASTFPGVTDGMLDVENWEEGRIIPGCWRQVKAEGMKNATFLHSNNYRRNASDVRDKYAEMFCSSEVVPWQWMMI